MHDDRTKLAWLNFSLRTLLLLPVCIAASIHLFVSIPLPSMFPAVPIYFGAWLLLTASYGVDVSRRRLAGLAIGTLAGIFLAFSCFAVFQKLTTVALGGGHYQLSITVISDSRPVAAVSFAGLRSRDVVPMVIDTYPAPEPQFVSVRDPLVPFNVDVGCGVRWSYFGRKYSQQYEVILVRIEYADGNHAFETIDVPRVDEPHARRHITVRCT